MSSRESNRKTNGICYLAPDVAVPSTRGSSVHVIELAASLTKLGHPVHVISRRIKSSDPEMEILDGFTIHRIYRWVVKPEKKSSFVDDSSELSTNAAIKWFYYLYLITIFRVFAFYETVRVTRKYQLDMILERETSFGAGALASLFTMKPMVLEIIGPRYSRLSAWRSRKVLYYTESMLRKWVDRKKCVAVSAGVNLSMFFPSLEAGVTTRKQLGLQTTDVVVGYVGTFQDWHGVDTLLQCASLIRQRIPELRLLLVGPNFHKAQKTAEQLGILSISVFPGPIDYNKVPSYINACDLLVALYNPAMDQLRKKYGIGSPIKVLEYMACEKPVVSTSVEPIPKIISSENLGILVPPGDVSKLSAALLSLVLEPKKAKLIGQNGRELVINNYSWGAVAKAVESSMSLSVPESLVKVSAS